MCVCVCVVVIGWPFHRDKVCVCVCFVVIGWVADLSSRNVREVKGRR